MDFCAIEYTIYSISRPTKDFKKVEIEFHVQFVGVNSILQLWLYIHKSIWLTKDIGNGETLCVLLFNEEQEANGCLCILLAS